MRIVDTKEFWMGAAIGLGTGFLTGIITIMVMGSLLPNP